MLTGKAIVLGDDVNTDDIISGKYLRTADQAVWREHIFEDYDPTLSARLTPEHFIVAGENFGCGSSREQAVVALKLAGIRVVIAKSYGRIFYRNCVNTGILPLVCDWSGLPPLGENDNITVDLQQNEITFANQYGVAPSIANSLINELSSCGGLLEYYKKTYGI